MVNHPRRSPAVVFFEIAGENKNRREIRVKCKDEAARATVVEAAKRAGWQYPGWSEPGLGFGMSSDNRITMGKLRRELIAIGAIEKKPAAAAR